MALVIRSRPPGKISFSMNSKSTDFSDISEIPSAVCRDIVPGVIARCIYRSYLHSQGGSPHRVCAGAVGGERQTINGGITENHIVEYVRR